MPIRYLPDAVILEQLCAVEEALPLLDHLREHPDCRIDLSACVHLHTAVLQTLAAAGRRDIIPPGDAGLAGWIMPLILAGDSR